MLTNKLGWKSISIVDHTVSMHKALHSMPNIKHRYTIISPICMLVEKIINFSVKKNQSKYANMTINSLFLLVKKGEA